MLKVCCLSDLHGRLPKVPECDVLVLAGDVAPDSKWFGHLPAALYAEEQAEWFDRQYREWEATVVEAAHILAIPGNHDWCLSLPKGLRTQWLIDKAVTVEGRRFYGTPWVPQISDNWNFEASATLRNERTQAIPAGLDLLITHAPPLDVLDQAWNGDHAGCEYIREAVLRDAPTHHVFGHIHEGRRAGISQRLGTTMCHNVAMWGKDWMPKVLVF